MNYCTRKDLEKRLPLTLIVKLTDDERVYVDSDTPDMLRRIREVLGAATGIIDSYLSGHYQVPLSDVPVIISDIATDIAVYKLYKRRPGTEIPQDIADDYRNAEKRLEKIQAGKINLDVNELNETDEKVSRGKDYRVTRKDRYFGKNVLDRMV